ncbi:hypothetical protein AB0L06_27470 [Spirillospora sp. NPDC052269]
MKPKRRWGKWSLDEDGWHSWWWIPITTGVLLVLVWAIDMIIEFISSEGDGVSALLLVVPFAVLFSGLPTYLTLMMGFIADRWPPVVAASVAGASGGLYLLAQDQHLARTIVAAICFLIAIAALASAWIRRRMNPALFRTD